MLDKQEIIAAFNKMDFGEAVHSTMVADVWLEKRKVNFETEEIEDIKYNIKGEYKLDDVFMKDCFYKEIVNELRKNIQLIAQLEMVVRGFTYQDSIKSINLFLEYLSFSSSIIVKSSTLCNDCKYPEMVPLSYIAAIIANYDLNGLVLKAEFKLSIILTAIKDIIKNQCEKYNVNFTIQSIIKCNWTMNNPIAQLYAGRTPVLVFSGADLESACESIVNAAYSEQGLMPWSVNTVFVQEDILDEVVLKLKSHLRNVRIGHSCNKQVDFSVPLLLKDYETQFEETLAHAKAKGIEVYQPEGSSLAVMFIGDKVYSNNVLEINNQKVPFINVMAFRSIKEAIALGNNQQQTYAACVWANDVSLVHEIVHKLHVDTVWINTHGIFHPSTSLTATPFDFSPWAADYYKTLSKLSKTGQQSWTKKTERQRIEILRDIGIAFAKTYNADSLERTMAQHMVTLQTKMGTSNVQIHGRHELKQLKVATGCVLISYDGNIERTFECALMALVTGNVVYLDMKAKQEILKLYEAIETALPEIFIITSLLNVGTPRPYKNKNIWTAIGENYV